MAGYFSFGQQKSAKEKPAVKQEIKIRQYWFVMLIKGNNRTHDSTTAANIQEGHMANINKLYNDGKLKVAEPLWRGWQLAWNIYF